MTSLTKMPPGSLVKELVVEEEPEIAMPKPPWAACK
jgi:hypothetical protein